MSALTSEIAIVGLGPMGAPIARRLLKHYGAITVWNRTASVAEIFKDHGARVAPNLLDAALPIVITVLPDLIQVEEVLEGLIPGWRNRGIANPILVIHGTVSPVAVRALSERLADQGISVVDAPVSGGTQGATDGSLSIMVGGNPAVAESLVPIFECYGTTIRYMGESGSGALTKLCNQVVVAAAVAALAEATVLARHGSLDVGVVFEILGGGLANSEVLRQKAPRLLTNDFAGGGSARNQLKDLRYIAEAAASEGVQLPVTRAATGLYQQLVEEGFESEDHSAVIKAVERLPRQE